MSRFWMQGPELGAYAALPFGVALAAYGSAIDNQVWPAGSQTILLAIGAASIISGIRILQTLPRDRRRPSYALRALAVAAPLAVAAAAIAAWAPTVSAKLAELALRDRQLAGVTIALPDGDELRSPTRAAQVSVSRIAGIDLEISVVWQIGSFDATTAQSIAKAGANNAGASAPEPLADAALPVGDRIAHRSFRIAKDGVETFITVLGCAPRIFTVLTGGAGALELSRRVLASVRCHPEPDAARPVPAIVELPADWTRAPPEPGQLGFVRGDEAFGVLALDPVADDLLQGTMEATARQIGANAQLGTDARLGPRRDVATAAGTRAVWTVTLTADGLTASLLLSAWRCPDRPVTLLTYHIGGRDEASSLELLGHVRCAANGERP